MRKQDDGLRQLLTDLQPYPITINRLATFYGPLEPFLPADRAALLVLKALAGLEPLPGGQFPVDPGDIWLVPSLTLDRVARECGSSLRDVVEGLTHLKPRVRQTTNA